MIYLTFKHKGPGDRGADPKSLALGDVTADAEPNSESTVTSHCQWQGIMFYTSRLYDTRCKILFASQILSVTKPGCLCTSASATQRGLVLESVVCGTSDDVSRHSVSVAAST
jgi:hypothetical protein